MTEYTISVTDFTDSVFESVYRLTANAAVQRGDAVHVATEDDNDLLNSFITEGCSLLEKAIARYSTGSLKYSMPDNWPDKSEDVNKAAQAFLVKYCLGKWYMLFADGAAFMTEANDYLMVITDILNIRSKPRLL